MISEIHWSEQAGFPVLSTLIAVPLVSMALGWLVRSRRQAFVLGIGGAGLELSLAIWLLLNFQRDTANLQFVERIPLTPFLAYHLGVDGINVLFVTLAALLTLLVILYGEIISERPAGIYVASVFAYQAVMMGLFLSVDLLEFWLVSLLELIPSVFILKRWGRGHEKNRAANVFITKMAIGLGLMLGGVVILGWHHANSTGDWSFALTDLLSTPISKAHQSLIFLLMFYGLGVRMALFPMHAWLPIVAQQGPRATLCVFLLGLKVSVYALLRFVLPLLPDAAHQWKSFVVVLGVASLFYGSLMALMQINLRRLLCFAAVSHSGMLAVGIFSLNHEGLQGSLVLAVNFGAAVSGLFFITGVIYRSTKTSFLPRLGGLFDMLPLLGLTFFLAALSNMAMPGTPGFDAAHLMLEGAIETHDWGVAVALAVGSVGNAAFLLWAFQRAFLAQRKETVLRPEQIRLSLSEVALAGAICAVLLGVGSYMRPWLEIVNGSLFDLAHRLETPARVD